MYLVFFFNDTATTEIYTLSLHDALPISHLARGRYGPGGHGNRAHVQDPAGAARRPHLGRRRLHQDRGGARGHELRRGSERSEEHTSELQSPCNLVCRLLLEKKKIQ